MENDTIYYGSQCLKSSIKTRVPLLSLSSTKKRSISEPIYLIKEMFDRKIPFFVKISNLGVLENSDPILAKKKRLTNAVALVLGIISFVFGWIYYVKSEVFSILLMTSLETILFGGVLLLNSKKRPCAASVLLQSVISMAVLFFGLMIGHLIDSFILGTLLILCSLYLLRGRLLQIVSILITLCVVLVLETNQRYGFMAPLELSESNARFFHYSAYAVVSFLILFTLLYYTRQYAQLNESLIKELISYQNDLEHKVQIRTQELERASQDRERYIRELSHEIRTPLTAMYTIAQMKQNQKTDTLDRDLIASCLNLVLLVNNIQDRYKIAFQAMDAVNRERFNVRSHLNCLINQMRYYAMSKDVMLEAQVTPNVTEILFEDKAKLAQILYNLIGNAIKFTPTFTTVLVTLDANESSWCIEISDEGRGIPPEQLSKLYSEYNRPKNASIEGSGIGLRITYELVQMLSGQIQVQSSENGTTFLVTLPIHDKFVTIPDASPTHSHTFGAPTLLLIEDDEMNSKLLEMHLVRKGYKMFRAHTGKEGIELARVLKPDIILSDWQLPEISGSELLSILKSSEGLANIPIVILSDAFNITRAQNLGAVHCVTKPIHLGYLDAILERIWKQECLHQNFVFRSNRLGQVGLP
jgi:signal transduction histidine kinase/CheY-like chemotaxis protein